MTNLGSIDKILTEQLRLLKQEISKFEFEKKFEFTLQNTFDQSLLEEIQYPGVYLVEIQTNSSFTNIQEWIKDFLGKWEDEKYKRHFVPNSRKKRINKHSEWKTWFPIYMGISEKISDRIKMHIFLKITQSTGALKLQERENLYGYNFRISTINVEVSNYDLIMPQIEKYFRNQINPILGV